MSAWGGEGGATLWCMIFDVGMWGLGLCRTLPSSPPFAASYGSERGKVTTITVSDFRLHKGFQLDAGEEAEFRAR
jgi:hypothetical protein